MADRVANSTAPPHLPAGHPVYPSPHFDTPTGDASVPFVYTESHLSSRYAVYPAPYNHTPARHPALPVLYTPSYLPAGHSVYPAPNDDEAALDA